LKENTEIIIEKSEINLSENKIFFMIDSEVDNLTIRFIESVFNYFLAMPYE